MYGPVLCFFECVSILCPGHHKRIERDRNLGPVIMLTHLFFSLGISLTIYIYCWMVRHAKTAAREKKSNRGSIHPLFSRMADWSTIHRLPPPRYAYILIWIHTANSTKIKDINVGGVIQRMLVALACGRCAHESWGRLLPFPFFLCGTAQDMR